MVGLLENAGIGKEAPVPEGFQVKELMEGCLERNLALFACLKGASSCLPVPSSFKMPPCVR